MGVFFGAGMSSSIPVRSKRLELGLPGEALHSCSKKKLGGGAGRKSNEKCRLRQQGELMMTKKIDFLRHVRTGHVYWQPGTCRWAFA